jgi:hypothetical protein
MIVLAARSFFAFTPLREMTPNQPLQPTAPLRYVFDADLSECDSTCGHLRLPEPWLNLISLGDSFYESVSVL